jgi:invasion protein IalB
MGFLIRFAACAVAILSFSVLAAMAWDGSDEAAGAATQQQPSPNSAPR